MAKGKALGHLLQSGTYLLSVSLQSFPHLSPNHKHLLWLWMMSRQTRHINTPLFCDGAECFDLIFSLAPPLYSLIVRGNDMKALNAPEMFYTNVFILLLFSCSLWEKIIQVKSTGDSLIHCSTWMRINKIYRHSKKVLIQGRVQHYLVLSVYGCTWNNKKKGYLILDLLLHLHWYIHLLESAPNSEPRCTIYSLPVHPLEANDQHCLLMNWFGSFLCRISLLTSGPFNLERNWREKCNRQGSLSHIFTWNRCSHLLANPNRQRL